MLQFIRSKVTSIFIKVLFCVLILSFAVWGIGDIFLGNPSGRTAISVGGVTYNSVEVLEQFDRARRAMRLPPQYDDALRPQILNSVIDSITEAGLYEAESRDLGMTVGEESLKKWVASSPAFRDQLGQFNPDVFRQTLSNAGLSEGEFFQTLRSDIKRDQINAAVAGEARLPNTLAETLFKYRAERRVANVVNVSMDTIKEIPEPSDAELMAHFEENKDAYKAPEYRGAAYVSLTPDELAKEILIPEEELRAEYNARQTEFATPATRDLVQYLFPDEAAATAAITSLTGPLDIDGLAKVLGEAAGADGTVSLDNVASFDLADVAERKAAFEAEIGDVSIPVETPFGWKAFLVKTATPESVIPFEDVKDTIRQEIAREKALDAMFELSNAFQDALAGGSTIWEAAREINVKVGKVENVDTSGLGKDGKPVEGIPRGQSFLGTLFETSKGAQSELVESENNGYFLLEVDRITATRLRDFSEVREAVQQSWNTEKRATLANELAGRISELSKGGVGLKAAAEANGYSLAVVGPFNRTGEGYDFALYPSEMAPIVFELTKGDVGLAEGVAGTVVAELEKVIAADRDKQKVAWTNLLRELETAARQDFEDTYLTSLRREHSVNIDRGYIDTLMAESQ
ncbi:MAG: SurA N-terminal domain-containing protein [Alphaproteobacteria bacterium]|nr:SurA N-terminal domain-containing protein [Alphaproteobacteria bacterium]